MQHGNDVRHVLDRLIVDREKQVTTCETDDLGRTPRSYLGRHDAFIASCPKDAVFDFVPGRPGGNIGCAETEEYCDHNQRQSRP
jgi:hypothetical protein